jgi:pyruvate dehydrogenase E2 component (dihydrolipoamide acetyltransferase)
MAQQTRANPNQFILPDLGEGVHEAELIKWRVKAGDTVDEHDILAEMETDKALVEVPSPRAGTIKELHGKEGEILNVGNVLVTYEGDGKSTAMSETPKKGKQKDVEVEAKDRSKKAPEKDEEEREDAGTVVGQMTGEMFGAGGKVQATPAVRRLARDLGVDINSCRGTGIGGRVTEKDVRAVAGGGATRAPAARVTPSIPSGATSSAPPPAPAQRVAIPEGADEARVPFRGVRRTIAMRLRQSVDQAVHFTVMDEADSTALDGLRKKLAAASGEKISFLPFVAGAVTRVLAGEFGVMNSTVDEADEDNAEIIQHRAVHLGIATDTGSGLMVPVIRDADKLGLLQMSREITRIANSARDRSIPREQLVGSTFTISNVGSHAGRFATPVINYPEVGILAVGRARDGMVVKDGWFRVGKLLPLSLACDHRVVDGATAALALARIVDLIQNPESLLEPARG